MGDFKIEDFRLHYYNLENEEVCLTFKKKDDNKFVFFYMSSPEIEKEKNEDKIFSLLSENKEIKKYFVSIPQEERVKFSSLIFNGFEFLKIDLSPYILKFRKKENLQITGIYFFDDSIEILIREDEKKYILSIPKPKRIYDKKIIIDQIDIFAKKINLEAQKIFKHIKL